VMHSWKKEVRLIVNNYSTFLLFNFNPVCIHYIAAPEINCVFNLPGEATKTKEVEQEIAEITGQIAFKVDKKMKSVL